MECLDFIGAADCIDGGADCICGVGGAGFICGEYCSMVRSWYSVLINAARTFFRYMYCPGSDHSDSKHETAGDSLTSTRAILASSASVMSAR